MSVEENKVVVRRSFEAFNARNWAVLDELVAPDFVRHLSLGAKQSWEGLREIIIRFANAFPDFQVSIEDMVAEGDKVVGRVTYSGTHRGEYMGIAPTNKRVTVNEIDIYRIVGGKIVEWWINFDSLGLLQQLDAVTIKTASE